MSVRDAEYVQLSHWVHGIPTHDRLSRWAIEPRRLEQRPWPRNLFGEPTTIAELMAESENFRQNTRTSGRKYRDNSGRVGDRHIRGGQG